MSVIVTKDFSKYLGYSSLYTCIQNAVSIFPPETGQFNYRVKLTKPDFVLVSAISGRYTKVPSALYSQYPISPLGIQADYQSPEHYTSSPKNADVSSSNILIYYITNTRDGSKYIDDIHTDWIFLNFVKEYSTGEVIAHKRPLKMILIAESFSPLEDTGVPIADIEGWTYITFDEIVADWKNILSDNPNANLLDFQTLSEKFHILEKIGDPIVYDEKLQNEVKYREMVQNFALQYPDFRITDIVPVNARPYIDYSRNVNSKK